jgi:hypothetical protein
MRVDCEVSYVTLTNDNGIDVDGVEVVCSRCGHKTQSFGTGERSVKRCLALMREECPEGECNFYVGDVEGGD